MMLLAEVEGERGEPDAALSLLEDLLREIDRTGQRWLDAEVHRQRGKLLLQRPPIDITAAEAAFELALGTARGQRTKTFELRAAMSMALLWRDQGKRTEARDLLARIYSRFTEGFDAPVLQNAKALLDELM
jgi:predicted ATPase